MVCSYDLTSIESRSALRACTREWNSAVSAREDVVLPGEDADTFEDLRNQVRANLSPVGPIEEFFVNRVVNAMWRLQRLAGQGGRAGTR
jgi:hypothetical protein